MSNDALLTMPSAAYMPHVLGNASRLALPRLALPKALLPADRLCVNETALYGACASILRSSVHSSCVSSHIGICEMYYHNCKHFHYFIPSFGIPAEDSQALLAVHGTISLSSSVLSSSSREKEG